jgi:hypothetical protein
MAKTSNSAEGWHNKIHRLLSTHPGIHSFISKIQKEQHETKATIESLISNKVFEKREYTKYGVITYCKYVNE